MSIMCSAVTKKDLVMFEIVPGRNGDPVYKISWYNGKKWSYARYRRFDDAHSTWRLISRMIED